MVLPEPGPPTSSVVRPLGKPPPVISSKPVIPVGAFVELCPEGERGALNPFLLAGMITSTVAFGTGERPLAYCLTIARSMVDAGKPCVPQATLARIWRIGARQKLDSIDVRWTACQRCSRKVHHVNCLQTSINSCRNLEWSRWRIKQQEPWSLFRMTYGHGNHYFPLKLEASTWFLRVSVR